MTTLDAMTTPGVQTQQPLPADVEPSGSTITITGAGDRRPLDGPAAVLGLGLAFMGSKVLLSAVELDLFTILATRGPASSSELCEATGLHPRSAADFLDALVSLGLLTTTGHPDGARRYDNSADAAAYLDRTGPTWVGGMLDMANRRLYPFWADLTEALRTGAPQNETKHGGDVFGAIYADPQRLRTFQLAMTGTSLPVADALTGALPWSEHRHVVDVGGAIGAVPATLVSHHPHLRGGVFELPAVEPVFHEYIDGRGLTEQVRFHGGDFFTDPLPDADVLVLGSILHDWGLEQKQTLISRAFAALPPGGRIVIYDALIDTDRRENSYGLLMSLNMLIETDAGFDYTTADAAGWLTAAGFREPRIRHLVGGYSMITAMKP